jgi:hypothetical protein
MKNQKTRMCTILALLFTSISTFAQQHTVTYDLQRIVTEHQFTVFNREASPLNDHEKKGLKLSAKDNDGVAWINDVTFTNGVIELDVRGKNAPQQSFLGVAFHGMDEKTLDAVYFRPFNFHAVDSVQRIHMVQYVSHPLYPWNVLREKFNGQYEKGISSPPNPDDWFHVRIEVKYPQIYVFINNQTSPCLTVKQLNNRQSGKLGLWVGNGSDGSFANLKVTFLK